MKIACRRTTFAAALALALAFATTSVGAAESNFDANGNQRPQPAGAEGGEDQAAELAKQLSNPIASLISVPFQANEDFGYGPTGNGYKFTLNIQPVIPISISKNWNLILRTILPVVSQHDLFYDPRLTLPPGFAQNRSQDGLSDTTQSFFFSPKAEGPGGIVWGLGPVMLYPTGTQDLLGGQKWGAGPTFVALKQTGGWTFGMLANHIWSFAGNDERNYISSTFLQPFITYTFKTHTTLALNTESTYNWEAGEWTVPINFTIGQILKLGKQPVQITLGGRYYATTPENGPGWGVRLVFTLLYPEAKRKPAPATEISAK